MMCSSIILLILVLFTGALLLESGTNTSESLCAICDYRQSHAPCILNLSTGEIDELGLYSPETLRYGSVRPEERTGGVFCVISGAGLKGYKVTDPWYIELRVPVECLAKEKELFCEACQEMLEPYSRGYVLVDLYDKDNPKAYPIGGNEKYAFRCYRIEITTNSEKEDLNLRVDGVLE